MEEPAVPASGALQPSASAEDHLTSEASGEIRHQYRIPPSLETCLSLEHYAWRVECIEQRNIPLNCLDEAIAVADMHKNTR
jgi:hypothetical protein